MRGYFGIGIYDPKKVSNIGTLWRTAHSFGADFIFTIGGRYKKEASDTSDASRHVPLFEFKSINDLPKNAEIVCIEISDNALDLKTFKHPERAIYILGAEDYGLPGSFTDKYKTVKIEGSRYCLNVSVAGSIVLYDRISKLP